MPLSRVQTLLASACLLGALANPVSAQSFPGTTAGGPTWNRPIGGTPPIVLSGIGTAVPYDLFSFYVSAAGTYSFVSTANWDNYTFLYRDSFSPTDQFTNVLIGNDDNPSVGSSGFNFDLQTGVNYFLVVT